MLREESASFSSRWDDVVREPDAYWQEWVGAAAEGRTRRLFVAEDEDVWIGAVGCHLRVDPAEAQLVSMWVSPAARRRGVARALIRAVAGWAHERGCDRVFLFVQEANTSARGLYERAGFRATGERQELPRRRGFKVLMWAPVEELLGATDE
jgi:ribosomal protein S18 acetylase RimI-like enzyme